MNKHKTLNDMKPEWKEFLVNRGAELVDDRVDNFGNPEREIRVVQNGNILVDLSHLGLISIRGEDALKFMQGQFTNDVQLVSERQSQFNSLCSPKGRMLGIFRLFLHSDTYYLHMPRNLIEQTINRLKMFVLMSKVDIEDASDAWIRIGLCGPDAEKELQDQSLSPPLNEHQVVTSKDLIITRVPGIHPRFEIFAGWEAMQKLWTAFDVHAAPVGSDNWELLDIKAGIPTVLPQTLEAFVPQMANMQLINGVSFKKGCYTGQEIVARMQYLGKLKRRMYLAHIDTSSIPEPGTPLFAQGSTSGQGAGKIVNAKRAPEGGIDALVVVEINTRENDSVHIGNEQGPNLVFEELPYPFSDAASAVEQP